MILKQNVPLLLYTDSVREANCGVKLSALGLLSQHFNLIKLVYFNGLPMSLIILIYEALFFWRQYLFNINIWYFHFYTQTNESEVQRIPELYPFFEILIYPFIENVCVSPSLKSGPFIMWRFGAHKHTAGHAFYGFLAYCVSGFIRSSVILKTFVILMLRWKLFVTW